MGKPLINQPRMDDIIAELRERSGKSVDACKEAEDKAIMLEEQHEQLIVDIENLKVDVEQNAGHVAAFVENQALIAAQKAELEIQVNDTLALYEQEQEAKNDVAQIKKRTEGDVANIKRDLEDLEMQLQKLNQEKETKDHQIRVCN